MTRYKSVNGNVIALTAAEEAELDAQTEAADLDMYRVRAERNGMLVASDWTQIGDAALGDHTAEEWRTYRQSLRDLLAAYSRVSEGVWPEDPPAAKITRKVTAGDAAREASLDAGDTLEEQQAAYDAAYAATE